MTAYEAQQKIIENNQYLELIDSEEHPEVVKALEDQNSEARKVLEKVGIFAI